MLSLRKEVAQKCEPCQQPDTVYFCVWEPAVNSQKLILVLHSPVELGQFNRENNARNEEDHAPAQTEPKGILDTEKKQQMD